MDSSRRFQEWDTIVQSSGMIHDSDELNSPLLNQDKVSAVHNTLSCASCEKSHEINIPQNLCHECSKPLLAGYPLETLKNHFTPNLVRHESADGSRPLSMWKFHEVLPVDSLDESVSLGEGGTPLLPTIRRGPFSELTRCLIKDESLNPTASFKSRGMAAAITRAKSLGITEVALPSAGNAAGAAAAYAARAGLPCWVFMPVDTPITNIIEASASGAHVVLVKGLIDDCGKLVREGCERHGWFDLSTLKEPFRIEGKKTMGYELPFDLFDVRENTRLRLPDCIIYPTGGGTGLIGMWKAFDEMEQLGWIGPERPRMVVAQASGCAPIVQAWDLGKTHAERIENAATVASGLRVPAAIGDFIMLRILKESRGTALAVSDQELLDAQRELTHYQGVFAAPESGATWAVAKKLLDRNWLKPHEEIILFNTSTGIKYSQDPPRDLPVVDPSKTDWSQILETT